MLLSRAAGSRWRVAIAVGVKPDAALVNTLERVRVIWPLPLIAFAAMDVIVLVWRGSRYASRTTTGIS